MKYYSLKNILSKNAHYNIIFGERSNGKTHSVLVYALERYFKTGGKLAIIRRWVEDFRGKRGSSMFNGIIDMGLIAKLSNNEWESVHYYSARWYMCKYVEGVRVTAPEPFAYGFSISSMEHDKSTTYPDVEVLLYDEFITRGKYIPNEFVLYMNVISTIVRQRNNVIIFMLGNTVNQYCPYFNEMGLVNVKTMKQGDIHVYKYGDSELKVAVEFSDSLNKKGKPSDLFFAFDNPKLSMITGGVWEMEVYPHIPFKYNPSDIQFIYFIVFDCDILQCEIVSKNDTIITYIHRKSGEIKNEDDLIFTPQPSHKLNHYRYINKPYTYLTTKIYSFFREDRVFYQDNEVGEMVRNYLEWCGK